VKTSKQARRDAKELIKACRVNGALDDAKVREVVKQVIASKPRGYFAILSCFQRFVRLDLARRTARIESAMALSEPQQAAIKSNLTRRYPGGLTCEFVQNADLLGGLRVQVGSDVYNGSVRARLAELESTL
jgi:F-type H+-transporting ATPase subunit delta